MKALPLLCTALLFSFSAARCAETKPNLVIFLADDAGWGDYGHSGNTQIATPHIDSIARDGVSLERFFVCPVCSPTRAEFLTGRYHPRGGVRGVSTGQERLNLDEKTLADAFQAAGYATGAFGKWHNGSQWPYHPMARGFDEYLDAPLEDVGRMVWQLEVHTAGRYEVSVDYTCPDADAGALIELSFRDTRLTAKVQPGWNPPLYTNQDSIPRHGESQMKEFHTLKLGEMTLPAGPGPLTLRALEIPGQSVMDVRRLTLTLLE